MNATKKMTHLPDMYFSADKSTPNVECVTWFGMPDSQKINGTYWTRDRIYRDEAHWHVTVIAPALMFGDQDEVNDEIRVALHRHAVKNGVAE